MVMKFFVAVLLTASFANGNVINSKRISYMPFTYPKSSGYFIAYGGYEDIRIFDNNTQKIKLWHIKRAGLQIDQYFKNGKINSLVIFGVRRNKLSRIVYKQESGHLKLVYAKIYEPRTFGFSGSLLQNFKSSNLCDMISDARADLSKISSTLNADILDQNIEGKIVPAECKNTMSDGDYYNIVVALDSDLNVGPNLNNFVSCIENKDTAKALSSASKVDVNDVQTDLEYVGLQYRMLASKFYNDPDSLKNFISCSSSESAPIAKAKEGGRGIIFFEPKDKKRNKPLTEADYDKAIAHELIHETGVVSDPVNNSLLSLCLDHDKDTASKEIVKFAMTDNLVVPQMGNLKETHANEVANTNIKIPKEIAETKIPDPPPEELNKPLTNSAAQTIAYNQNPEASATQALATSVGDSQRVYTMANMMMAGFVSPAVASSRSIASVDDMFDGSGSGSSSRGSGGGKAAKANDDSDPYKVTEEYEIHDPNTPAGSSGTPLGSASAFSLGTSGGSGSQGSSGAAASDEMATNRSVAVGRASGHGSGGAASFGGGSGGGIASSGDGGGVSGSSGAGGASGNTRSIASVAKSAGKGASSGNASAPSGTEVISTLKNMEYHQAKKKLSDRGFVDSMKNNSITVVDQYGHSLGADHGHTVFLDRGDRFVWQK